MSWTEETVQVKQETNEVNNENTCARNEAEKPDYLKTEVKTERQSGLEEEEDGDTSHQSNLFCTQLQSVNGPSENIRVPAHKNLHNCGLRDKLFSGKKSVIHDTVCSVNNNSFSDQVRDDNCELWLNGSEESLNLVNCEDQTTDKSHCVYNMTLRNDDWAEKFSQVHSACKNNAQISGNNSDDSSQSVANMSQRKCQKSDRPYKCDVCGKGFNNRCYVSVHTRMHRGEKPYKCDMCNAEFNQKYNIMLHLRTHTGEKPYKCDICDTRFTQKCNLKKHKKTHTGEKPYICDVCNGIFAQKHHLSEHKRIHTGERPYICDVCNASFSQRRSLHSHKRTHTGEKPYCCDICEARFSDRQNLKSHIRIHTGEKPFKCDSCGARFTQKQNLNSHKRIHTGEKPYKCDVCDARFTQKQKLNSHKRTHSGEKLYNDYHATVTHICSIKNRDLL